MYVLYVGIKMVAQPESDERNVCGCRHVGSLLRVRHDLLHCDHLLRQLQGGLHICLQNV